MSEDNKPKWQREIEAILAVKFASPDYSKKLMRAYELINLVADRQISVNSDEELGKVVSDLLSLELPSFTATYTGFMLGVAYEKSRNE